MSTKGKALVKLSNGILMPTVALGTWQATATNPCEVVDAVKHAINVGYRHIDTAPLYQTEVDVGKGIQAKLKDGTVKREDLFITTKLWSTFHEASEVKKGLMKSLKDLQLDYLDLYIIHWPFSLKGGGEYFPRDQNGVIQFIDVPFMETWNALEKCVDEGLIKAIGLSNYGIKQIQHILDRSRIKPAAIQLEVHPYFRQDKIVKYCQDNNIVVTAFSPLGSSARPWQTYDNEANPEPLFKNKDLIAIGKTHGKTSAQVALRWLVQRGLSLVPKSATPSRIKENFEIMDFNLSPIEMSTINAINRNLRLITYTAVMYGAGPGITDPRPSPKFMPFLDE